MPPAPPRPGPRGPVAPAGASRHRRQPPAPAFAPGARFRDHPSGILPAEAVESASLVLVPRGPILVEEFFGGVKKTAIGPPHVGKITLLRDGDRPRFPASRAPSETRCSRR